jgi:hypothetical protein
MLAIGIIGLTIDTAIRLIGQRLLPWSLVMSK